MKALLLLGVLLAATTSAIGPPSLADAIRAARWKSRVMLVAAPATGQADFQRQKKLLDAAADQMQARDLLVLEALHDQFTPADRQYLQQKLGLKLTGFEVVLIGKDGGVKLRRTQPVAPAELFGLIDQMPMRRAEMRQRP